MTNEQIAEKLFLAYKNDELTENLSEDDMVQTFDDAYKVQKLIMDKKIDLLNEKITGAKVGLTSKAALAANNMDEPFFAPLTDKDFFSNDLSMSECPGLSLVELEIIFKATNDISKDATQEEIIKNTQIALSVEIPTRRTIKPANIMNVTADLGSAGNVFYLNNFIPTPDVDALACFKGRVYLNGEVIAQGTSDAVLDNPINTVLFANKMMNKLYGPIKKGMFILSGSLTPPLPISKGEYRFEIEGLGETTFNVVD
jgi:2-keto-4-pentenoate hydratase